MGRNFAGCVFGFLWAIIRIKSGLMIFLPVNLKLTLLLYALIISISCAGPQKPAGDAGKSDARQSEEMYENEPGEGDSGADGEASSTAGMYDGLGAVVDVAAGGQHACALHESGRVSCWGRNHLGQLGDGSTGDRWRAAPVADATEHTSLCGDYDRVALSESFSAKLNVLLDYEWDAP